MPTRKTSVLITIMAALIPALSAVGQSEMPGTADRPSHQESASQQDGSAHDLEPPLLPEGMTLDEVLDYSAGPPPAHFPAALMDDRIYVFTLFEKLEYRVANGDMRDHLGWDAQGWIGGDFNKFWWKSKGAQVFDGPDHGEMETDLLYSRLITPFWSFQIGVQYANEWNGEYKDRWSGVIALQGLAPYMFEFDNSLYISEDGDVTAAIEAEYDIRITQRLVLQPLVEVGIAFQDVRKRNLGAGITDANLDLRLRYEIKREFAPYVGVRYHTLIGKTHNIAKNAGKDTDQLFFIAGLRFAF